MIANSDWRLLDIEPTIDVRQIKKAYAKKLKLYSPEDDPVQFQILREVYERVLQYAKYADSLSLTENIFDTEDSTIDEDTLYDSSAEELEIFEKGYVNPKFSENGFSDFEMQELADAATTYEKFVKQVTDLYENYNNRIDPKKWEEIIKDEVMWDVDTYRILKEWFLDFLYDGHFVPSEVLQSYNKYFLWDLNSEEYYQRYDESFLTYIKVQLDGIITPGYEYLMKDSCEDIEAYISYREHGFAQYLIGDWETTRNIRNALEMIPDEPYLLCVFGAYYDATNNGNGKKYIKLAAEYSTDPWRMFLLGGQLLQIMGMHEKALRYFREIPSTSNYYIIAMAAITDCLCNMDKYFKCGFLLRSKLKKNKDDTELKDVLLKYYDTILESNRRYPYRLVFLYEARKTFRYIRKRGEKPPHKFTFKYFLSSLKLLAIIILGGLLLMGIILTKGGLIAGVAIVYALGRLSGRKR